MESEKVSIVYAGYPIEFEARPTEGSRERCGGSTPESLCRAADGRLALSTSSANRDGILLDAI